MSELIIDHELQAIIDSSVDLGKRIERQGEYAVVLGGYADIWHGRLSHDDGNESEVVALKFLRLGLPDPKILKNIKKEYKVWSRLHHPNILRFLGISTRYGLGQPCLVSPWQNNGHAIEYLSAHYTNDSAGHEMVFRLIEGIIHGLAYLHICNVVHGDLKGNNVLVSRDGCALLTDFGLSTVIDDLDTTSSESFRAGAYPWMAPERIFPEKYNLTARAARSPASDIYSLGMTIYEILSGDKPFKGSSSPAVILKIYAKARPPLAAWRMNVNQSQIICIMELCWKDCPSERPTAAAALHILSDTGRDPTVVQSIPSSVPFEQNTCDGQLDTSQMIQSSVLSGPLLLENHVASETSMSSFNSVLYSEEKLESILKEDCARKLQWIRPREHSRWIQPAGRSSHLGNRLASGNTKAMDEKSITSSRAITPPPNRLSSGTFRSSEFSSVHIPDDPHAWMKHISPSGELYFLKEDKDVTFITDSYIVREEVLLKVERWRKILARIVRAQKQSQVCPDKWEVYLRTEETGGSCYYYMIDHDKGHVFWAHEVDKRDLHLDDTIPESGLELLLQIEFWAHVEVFSHTVPLDAEMKLRGMLIYADIDSATAPRPTTPYASEECSRFLQSLERLSGPPVSQSVKHHVIARLTRTFLENEHLTFYGEEGARFERGQPSHSPNDEWPSGPEKILLWVLQLTLFGADVRQMEKINEVIVDDVVLPRLWSSFMARFARSTDQTNIVAAIILAANITFLTTSNLTTLQSTTQLLSTLFSLSGLLIGLHHSRQTNLLLDSDCYIGVTYLRTAFFPSYGGHRLLAIFHSLPLAFLIWSILLFCVSIGLLAHQVLLGPVSWSIFIIAGITHILVLAASLYFFREEGNRSEGRHLIWRPVEYLRETWAYLRAMIKLWPGQDALPSWAERRERVF